MTFPRLNRPRIGYRFVWSLLVAAFAATSDRACASVNLELANPCFSVSAQGVTLSEVHPRVQVLLGEERTLLDWTPTEPGKVTRERVNTPLGAADSTVVAWEHPAGFTLRWIIANLRTREGFAIRCELQNTGAKPLRLRRFFVVETSEGALKVAGNPADWMTGTRYLKYARYYDSLGELLRRGQLSSDNSRTAKDIRRVPYDEDFTLYTTDGDRGLSISAVEDQTFIETHLSVPEDGRLGLDVTSEMTGVRVDPAESRRSEQLLVLFEPWREASLGVVKWVGATIKPRGTPPVFGWCSWYSTGGHVREDHCFDTATFVASRRDRYPFEVLQVDEGWGIGRHSWHANGKFGRGMTALAQAFAAAGSKPGVWLSPATPTSQHLVGEAIVNSPPDVIAAGTGKGLRSFPENWYVGSVRGQPGGGLDPSSPPAREYMLGELRRLYAQGYRYFKTDFSLVGNLEAGYRDPKKTHFQMQRELYGLFREGIGEDSYLLACNGGPPRVVLGLADATRIGTDSQQKWSFCYAANRTGKPDDVHGSWFPILQIGCASFSTHLMACDPDVTRLDPVGNLMFDPRFEGTDKKTSHYQTLETVRTFHGIQALYGGTMMVSDLVYKPHYQTEHRLRMLELMHPVTPDKGYNLAGGADILNQQFGFAAERPWGRWVSMVVWNPDHKGSRDLRMHRAPVQGIGGRFHLWSFWDEKYLGIQDASYVFPDVHHYHSHLLRLTPLGRKNHPVLVGLNFHMSMGSAELKNVSTGEGRIAVDLVPGAGALEGQLVVFSEKPLKVVKARGCEAFVVQTGENLYTAVVTGRDRTKPQHVALGVSADAPRNLAQVKADPELAKKWCAGSSQPW